MLRCNNDGMHRRFRKIKANCAAHNAQNAALALALRMKLWMVFRNIPS